MTTQTIKPGKPITLTVSRDDTLDIPGTWAGRVVVRRGLPTGPEVIAHDLTLADGSLTVTLDTTSLSPGTYYYDTRVTDADGYDHHSETVKLVIDPSPTGASV